MATKTKRRPSKSIRYRAAIRAHRKRVRKLSQHGKRCP